MKTYFDVNFELSRERALELVCLRAGAAPAAYVCVADGVVLDRTCRDAGYRDIVNGSLLTVCDSRWVTLYLRLIHGVRLTPYYGNDIFRDIVALRRHRMIFLGGTPEIHEGMRRTLSAINPGVREMTFIDLPFTSLDGYDYKGIAEAIEADGAEIIWVSLGAPKQEEFMHRLRPWLRRGVMVSVGAVFKFNSGGQGERRAPDWMVRNRLEFVYRIIQHPRKQISRCRSIMATLPRMLWREWRASRRGV